MGRLDVEVTAALSDEVTPAREMVKIVRLTVKIYLTKGALEWFFVDLLARQRSLMLIAFLMLGELIAVGATHVANLTVEGRAILAARRILAALLDLARHPEDVLCPLPTKLGVGRFLCGCR